jgi:hypothetical protein
MSAMENMNPAREEGAIEFFIGIPSRLKNSKAH